MKSKRGSITVYAVIIISSLIILITFLISIAKGMLAVNGAYALGNVWASSILGEYDAELYRRYGIFGYVGDESTVSRKIEFLSDYSFKEKNYASLSVTGVDLYDYSLMEKDNLMPQIRDICLSDFFETVSSGSAEARYVGESESSKSIEGSGVISELPSYGKTGSISLESLKEGFEKITSLSEIVKSGTDSFFINQYIENRFRNMYYVNSDEPTYLLAEQEYILSGRESDEANRKSARNKIIGLREVMNFLYLQQDEGKREAALLAGEAITLGYGGPEAAQLIMAAWALAESVNDYELLQRGKPVPLMKTSASWAIDLDSVIDNEETGCVDTGTREGDYYTDYIMYLLYLTGDNTKLLRILDLIELNLRESYSSRFRVSDCYVGIGYSININGKNYDFKETY